MLYTIDGLAEVEVEGVPPGKDQEYDVGEPVDASVKLTVDPEQIVDCEAV